MSNFGKNMKITVDGNLRALARRLFTEALGCTATSPRPDVELYRFDDGFSLGAFYTDKAAALEPRDHMKAPWLEIAVDDPPAVAAKLAELGITPFEYVDREHTYFCPPCGPVFRLAKR